jgi:hypothetical protein
MLRAIKVLRRYMAINDWNHSISNALELMLATDNFTCGITLIRLCILDMTDRCYQQNLIPSQIYGCEGETIKGEAPVLPSLFGEYGGRKKRAGKCPPECIQVLVISSAAFAQYPESPNCQKQYHGQWSRPKKQSV